MMMETVLKDARFAFRSLARSPGFTFVAVTTLAVAIAANAAVFGVVLVVLGAAAFKPSARKHAIHVALLIALVGALGTDMRIPTTLGEDGSAKALASQALTLLTCAGYLALGIRSFIAARKARKQAKLAES